MGSHMNPVICVVAALLFVRAGARAEPNKEDLVKGELLADVTAVKPGGTFNVGVLLRIERGWHVYWTNPGDSGLPTKVKLHVPEGFKVGEVRMPVPVKFDQPGGVLGYGYERE